MAEASVPALAARRWGPWAAVALVGLVLMVLGLGGSLGAVLRWGREDFGPLDVRVTLRGVIPAVLALTIGLQVALSSFFLSVLQLKVRRVGPGPEAR